MKEKITRSPFKTQNSNWGPWHMASPTGIGVMSALEQALDTALHCLELIRRQEVLEDAGVIIITLKACLEIPKGFDNLAGEGLACKVPQHGA